MQGKKEELVEEEHVMVLDLRQLDIKHTGKDLLYITTCAGVFGNNVSHQRPRKM